MTLVTAADARYWRCLWQLLRHLERRDLVRRLPCIAYDLGLAPAHRARLARRFPWCRFRSFAYASHPPHVALAHGNYAWKAAVLRAALADPGGRLLWMDSANLLHGDPDAIERVIERLGTFTLHGQAPLRDRCDRGVRERLDVPPEVVHLPERVTGVIGLDADRPAVAALVEAWYRGCMDPSLLTPQAPATERHMFEQALFGCLLLGAAWRGELELNDDAVDISCATPYRGIATRNKVGPAVPTWLDALVRARYAAEKALDRWYLAGRRQLLRLLDGAWRYPQEYYQVQVESLDGRRRAVLDSGRASYFADPFPVIHQGRAWLFVEELRYAQGSAVISALPLDADLRRAGPPQAVLDPGCHVSFPYLFRHAGELYMLPETSSARTLDLYRCVAMPAHWQLVRRLFDDVDFADTVLLEHDGRWFMVTSVQDHAADGTRDGNRWLAIFHAAAPDAATWLPHPVNARRLYREQAHGYGRNAGSFVHTADGALLRPMQSSVDHYGQWVDVMQVTRLTTEAFEERPYTGGHTVARLARGVSIHHVACRDGLVAWDSRLRTTFGDALHGRRVPRPRSVSDAAPDAG